MRCLLLQYKKHKLNRPGTSLGPGHRDVAVDDHPRDSSCDYWDHGGIFLPSSQKLRVTQRSSFKGGTPL